MTSQEMEMMTQYYYEQDYSNCSDWSVLFSSHKDFCYALHHTNHVMHKQAKQIKACKDRNLNFNNSFDELTQRSVEHHYSNLPNWAK